MAFGGDLPYFPNLLSGSPSKQEIPNELGGDGFSIAGSNSSNALVPNNVHHFDHAVPFNGSNLNPHHPISPFANEFYSDFNAYASSVFAPDCKNGNMHGLGNDISLGLRDNPQKNLVHSVVQTEAYLPLNTQQLGSTNGSLAENMSCTAAETNKYLGKVDLKQQQRLHMRKASKARKKYANIIKGQWTPQEDRPVENYISSFLFVLFLGKFRNIFSQILFFFVFFLPTRVLCLVLLFTDKELVIVNLYLQAIGAIGRPVWYKEMVSNC